LLDPQGKSNKIQNWFELVWKKAFEPTPSSEPI